MIHGKPSKYTCGVAHCGPALECALQALLGRVAQAGYVPQARAASFGFVRDSSDAQLANSLAHHAEKLALADLVCHECDVLDISVSIKACHASAPRPRRTPLRPRESLSGPRARQMCVDCHDFMKHASVLLGKQVRVKEL